MKVTDDKTGGRNPAKGWEALVPQPRTILHTPVYFSKKWFSKTATELMAGLFFDIFFNSPRYTDYTSIIA